MIESSGDLATLKSTIHKYAKSLMGIQKDCIQLKYYQVESMACPKSHINKDSKCPMESKQIHAIKNNYISIKILSYIEIYSSIAPSATSSRL